MIGTRSGDQPTLTTVPSGLQICRARVERTTGPRRITDDVGTEGIQRPHDLLERLIVDIHHVRGAEGLRHLEPGTVGRTSGDHERVGAVQGRHLRAQQANRAGARCTTTRSPGLMSAFTHIDWYATQCGSVRHARSNGRLSGM